MVSVQAENTGGSVIDCVKVIVKFLDSAGEVFITVSANKYDIAPGQTYDFEIAPDALLLKLSVYKEPSDYKIEVGKCY